MSREPFDPSLATTLVLAGLTFAGCALLILGGPKALYALDDPYIHLSMARHFVQDGVWGISATHNAAATSSPLWTLLLTGWHWLLGGSDRSPLWLQLPVLMALSWVIVDWLQPLPDRLRMLAGPIVLALVGLPALLLTGMEHLLHVLLALSLVSETVKQLGTSTASSRPWLLSLLAGAALATRYETVFLLIGTGCVLVAARAWRPLLFGHGGAAVVGVAAAAWNMYTGVGPLPNSVVAKSALLGSTDPVSGVFGAVTRIPFHLARHEPYLLGTVLMVTGAALVLSWKSDDAQARVGAVILVVTTALHLCFAQLGWLFRYEAWLLALGMVVAARGWVARVPSSPVVRVLAGVAFALLLLRFGWSSYAATEARHDIRRQHLPAAELLAASFNGEVVAANDVGAISFYADIDVMDLVGLGDNEILQARREGIWGPDFLEQVGKTRHASVAVVYDAWFDDGRGLPKNWVPVADWDAGDTLVAGSPIVSWYAIEADPARLRAALEAHPPPADVEVRWR